MSAPPLDSASSLLPPSFPSTASRRSSSSSPVSASSPLPTAAASPAFSPAPSASPSVAASRRPSVLTSPSLSLATSSPSPVRAPSMSLQQHKGSVHHVSSGPPGYVSGLQAFTCALSQPTLRYASPFSTSTIYALSPHEAQLLFQSYHSSGADANGLPLSAFLCLLRDVLQAVQAGLVSRGLGELSERVADWLVEWGGVEGLGGRLFAEMDRQSKGRLEAEELSVFLLCIDQLLGERLRREWKRKVVLHRLWDIARL